MFATTEAPMHDDECGPQRRLEGEELEAARRAVRWMDPEVCGLRLEMAGTMPGTHMKPRFPNTAAAARKIVNPWDKPEVADAARRRGGDKNKLAASIRKGQLAGAAKNKAEAEKRRAA